MKLRPYQQHSVDKLFEYFEEHEGKHPCIALPTGAGKTLVIADIIQRAKKEWPTVKIVVLSHVKEILQQDHSALTKYLHMPIGLWSSGLNSNSLEDVTVAGIQTVYDKAEFFDKFELVIIDEAHLIPPSGEGMYQTFLKNIGPHVRIGLTATPYRLGSGYIFGNDDTTMFDDIVVDYTYMDKFNELIDQGYLCNLRTFATKTELDTNGIRTTGGDFNDKDMSDKFDRDEITREICKEIMRVGEQFKKWLIFAIDIKHAEHITEILLQSGIKAYIVHSKMGEKNRDNIINMFKMGKLRAIVNVNILTTGFDAPDIDLIALLRPTKSPVIHVQSVGRGLRPHPNKDHTMVLDFAGNTERLGPINDIKIKSKRKTKTDAEPVTKRCPECNAIHHPSVRICTNCGYEFKFQSDLRLSSSGAAIISKTKVYVHDVDEVRYKVHKKANAPDSMLVTYQCGLRQFREWICIEHEGYAGHKARHWVGIRLVPNYEFKGDMNAENLVEQSFFLKMPKQIEVSEGGKYANILKYLF